MVSVDTNILVRYAVKDDPRQTELATAILAENHCFILCSVVLETAWVLETAYAYSPAQVFERLAHIFSLPTIAVEAYPAVISALDRYAAGLDFADALHLSLSEYQNKDGLLTFDKKFANAAGRLNVQHSVKLVR